jgi:hypothetical protein
MRPNLPTGKKQQPTPAERAAANNRIGVEVRRPKKTRDYVAGDPPRSTDEALEPERWDGMS